MTSHIITRFSAVCALIVAGPASSEIFSDDAFIDYVGNVENGAQIYAAAGCATCHGVDGDDTLLAGGRELSTKFGELYAPNITHDDEYGIGSWSNAAFLNAVINGTSPEGNVYFSAVFPYPSYSRMTPEDVLDLRAFLKKLPTSDAQSKPHDLSYMSQTILDMWSTTRAPLVQPSNPQLARGQYLVEAVGHCAECHTPRDTGLGFRYDVDETKAFAGEVGLLGEFAPDIRSERLLEWGLEAFANGAMAQSTKLNGNPMTKPSMRRISQLGSKLAKQDRAAMFAYLTGTSVSQEQIEALPDVSDVDKVKKAVEKPIPAVPDLTEAPKLAALSDAYCEAKPSTGLTETSGANGNGEGQLQALEAQADQLIETYCRSCHAPGKTFAGVFKTGDIADMKFDRKILTRGKPKASPLYESIYANRMPTGVKMSSDELAVIGDWITALGEASAVEVVKPEPEAVVQSSGVAAPRYADVSWNARMLAMVDDISAIEQRDRKFMRYLSVAATPLSLPDCDAEGGLRNPMHYVHSALNKFVNSVSTGPRPVMLTPVRGTEGTILRLDMRDYGWTDKTWEAISTGTRNQLAIDAGFTQKAWDDIAQTYPYAVDPASDPLLKVVADAVGAPVPLMRADWFTHFGAEAPFYDLFLGLTGQIKDLEMGRLGIDVDREILSGRVVRAAMLPGSSGVSDHNRMLERFELPRGGYYWKSYDFAGDNGPQSLTIHPDGPFTMTQTRTGMEGFEHDGGEMIFSLPNGLQGYYLSTAEGERLTVGPAAIVSFRSKPIGKGVEIENARSCFDCHENGMVAKSDEMRELLEATTRIGREQRDMLLEMYVDNDTLDGLYRQDSATFLDALAALNAVEFSKTGQRTSLAAPEETGGGEIITYLADMQFQTLDAEQIAREFQLDGVTFRERAQTLGDPQLMLITLDWLARADAGIKIHRSEVDTVFGELIGRITDLKPYTHSGEATYTPVVQAKTDDSYRDTVSDAVSEKLAREESGYTPAVTEPSQYTPPAPLAHDRLTLALSVPKSTVYVNDLLEFQISANKRCELQVFYVEASKEVVEMPQEILGPRFLEAGENRVIPNPDSGLQIRFDEPGKGETMLAFCREGGLGEKRMTAQGVLDYAASRYQPLTRGVIIEAARRVEESAGDSATNHVTFNVLQ